MRSMSQSPGSEAGQQYTDRLPEPPDIDGLKRRLDVQGAGRDAVLRDVFAKRCQHRGVACQNRSSGRAPDVPDLFRSPP